jgi:hypothetical protein
MSIFLGFIDWAICLVVLSLSNLFGLYLAVRENSSADSSRFFLASRSLFSLAAYSVRKKTIRQNWSD